VSFLMILGQGVYFFKVNIGGTSIYRRGIFPRVLADGRLVAILDLASDCLGCSQLIIRLENTLGETCTSPLCQSNHSIITTNFNAFGISTDSSQYTSTKYRNFNRNDNITSTLAINSCNYIKHGESHALMDL
jgi:hypothetical protein